MFDILVKLTCSSKKSMSVYLGLATCLKFYYDLEEGIHLVVGGATGLSSLLIIPDVFFVELDLATLFIITKNKV